jgi:hypothetical protein
MKITSCSSCGFDHFDTERFNLKNYRSIKKFLSILFYLIISHKNGQTRATSQKFSNWTGDSKSPVQYSVPKLENTRNPQPEQLALFK